MNWSIIPFAILLTAGSAHCQELFILTEPASNMPAKSIGLRLNNYIVPDNGNALMYRFNPELMWGINKNFMLHANFYAGNMQQAFHPEGGALYFKYRFLSIDNNKRHVRMAAYTKASLINNPVNYDEINLGGDNSGFTGGFVATQLLHKLALSFTGGYMRSVDNRYHKLLPGQSRDAVNYSLSAGYLFLPFSYKNYDQPNLNLYVEFLGKSNLSTGEQFLDFAPGVQFIFKSRMRLDFAYRRQLAGNMFRIANQEFIVKFEYTIFNAYNGVKEKGGL